MHKKKSENRKPCYHGSTSMRKTTVVLCIAETISKLFTVPLSKRVITAFLVENELYIIT